MNQPFGTKSRHLDKVFLRKAASLARVVYSIYKSVTRGHITKYLQRHGCKMSAVNEHTLDIPKMFEHHKKRRHAVDVDCCRIETRPH
jgi:predicted RNA methylase